MLPQDCNWVLHCGHLFCWFGHLHRFSPYLDQLTHAEHISNAMRKELCVHRNTDKKTKRDWEEGRKKKNIFRTLQCLVLPWGEKNKRRGGLRGTVGIWCIIVMKRQICKKNPQNKTKKLQRDLWEWKEEEIRKATKLYYTWYDGSYSQCDFRLSGLVQRWSLISLVPGVNDHAAV